MIATTEVTPWKQPPRPRDGADWTHVAWLPTALDKVLRDLGYQPEAVISGWDERGWLQHETGRRTSKVSIAGHPQRCVIVTRQGIDTAEA